MTVSELSHRGEQPRRILFVCVENSCRSQMAEAFARLYGGGRVEAYSAGSRPSGQIHPMAIAAMRERGYNLEGHWSKGLSDLPAVEYGLVVTMGCGDACPGLRALAREDWIIPCPKHMPLAQFRAVRDLIEEKVQVLLAQLAAERTSLPTCASE